MSQRGAMVEFVRDRLAYGIQQARESGNMIITHGVPAMGVRLDLAEQYARNQLHAAETRVQFFEETVVPYLGTAGPTGRIAEQQLRLLASEHRGDPGYGETCGARTVFWPDDEACDAECFLPPGHDPDDVHEDEILGRWSEDELTTHRTE